MLVKEVKSASDLIKISKMADSGVLGEIYIVIVVVQPVFVAPKEIPLMAVTWHNVIRSVK